MVSLLDFTEKDENGVTFRSPIDGNKKLLTPEESIRCQVRIIINREFNRCRYYNGTWWCLT